jgi:hypothetical protein
VNKAGRTQNIEVMGSGRFGDIQFNLVTRQLASFGECPHNGDSTRIRKRLHHIGESDVSQYWMRIALHRLPKVSFPYWLDNHLPRKVMGGFWSDLGPKKWRGAAFGVEYRWCGPA